MMVDGVMFVFSPILKGTRSLAGVLSLSSGLLTTPISRHTAAAGNKLLEPRKATVPIAFHPFNVVEGFGPIVPRCQLWSSVYLGNRIFSRLGWLSIPCENPGIYTILPTHHRARILSAGYWTTYLVPHYILKAASPREFTSVTPGECVLSHAPLEFIDCWHKAALSSKQCWLLYPALADELPVFPESSKNVQFFSLSTTYHSTFFLLLDPEYLQDHP